METIITPLMEMNVSSEEIVKGEKRKGMSKNNLRKVKKSNPKFRNHLFECLDKGKHLHMLRYVDLDQKIFEVIFIDKKNKRMWEEKYISLFKDMDEYLGERKHTERKCLGDCKSRFRANMHRCLKDKNIEKISSENVRKCKRIEKYRFLEKPQAPVPKANRNGGNIEKWKLNKKGNSSRRQEDGRSKIMHLASAPQTANYESVLQAGNIACDNIEENNHYLCLLKNQTKMDNEGMNSKFLSENGKNVDSLLDFHTDGNTKMDNEGMNSKFLLENGKNVDSLPDFHTDGNTEIYNEGINSKLLLENGKNVDSLPDFHTGGNMEMDNEGSKLLLENGKNVDSLPDFPTDGNGGVDDDMDFEATLENLENVCFDENFYLELWNVENVDNYQNIAEAREAASNEANFLGDDKILEFLLDDLDEDKCLKGNPYLSSAQKEDIQQSMKEMGKDNISNDLGDTGDWPCIFQDCEKMELI